MPHDDLLRFLDSIIVCYKGWPCDEGDSSAKEQLEHLIEQSVAAAYKRGRYEQ